MNHILKKKKSKYQGVNWYSALNKWRAHIKVDKRDVHLGYFDDEEVAGGVYAEAFKMRERNFVDLRNNLRDHFKQLR